jgi:hypothetical protein
MFDWVGTLSYLGEDGVDLARPLAISDGTLILFHREIDVCSYRRHRGLDKSLVGQARSNASFSTKRSPFQLAILRSLRAEDILFEK